MSDIVTHLRAMHLETAMPIYCDAANAIEKAEAELDAAYRAMAWLLREPENPDNAEFRSDEQYDEANADYREWYGKANEHAAVIEAARKLGGE